MRAKETNANDRGKRNDEGEVSDNTLVTRRAPKMREESEEKGPGFMRKW